ncbi:MAG: hypothetical protein FJX34_04155 [Alphaproteobacteria bacterium]|nr:hypothetical protein [Alphaproteobacteria bacterium]
MRKTNPQIQNIFLKFFGKILRPHEIEPGKLCAASYTLIATCITFFFFKKEIAITGFLIMVISDTLSALVGKAIQSPAFFEKTILGTAAFGFSALIILITCGIIFHMPFWFYFFGLFAVFCVTMVEARPSFLAIDDNLTIPLTFCFLMTGFHFMWG